MLDGLFIGDPDSSQIKINPASYESGVLIISSWQHPARVG
jgi:hypothetical protein